MIEIKARKGLLEVSGHAGYAENGRDIVCAAVSILCYSFLAALQKEGRCLWVNEKIRDGYMKIAWGTEKSQEAEVEAQLELVMDGFFLLEAKYGNYIKIFSGVG